MEAEGMALQVRGRHSEALLATVWSVGASTLTLGALVFLATWGGGVVAPYVPPALDSSAHTGFHMAAMQGLDSGPGMLFSYGPLGFLKSNLLLYVGTARLAALYGIAVHLALSISLVWALRRNFPAVVAVALALVVAVLARGEAAAIAVRLDAAVVILALIWCVAALSIGSPGWTRRIVVYGGGPFAAIETLSKLNAGLIVLALVAITLVVIEEDRWRNLAIAGGSFAASAAALWLAAGQGFDAIGPLVTGSAEIVSGYSSGALLDWGARRYDFVLAPAVIAIALLIAWVSTREMTWPRRAALLAIVAMVAWQAAKGGFVSHENFHMATFYTTMLGVCAAFPLPSWPRIRFGALAATAGVAAAAFTASFPGYPMTNPLENARNGFVSVATLLDTGRLEREIEGGRAALVAGYGIDSRSLELLQGHTVHIDPSEAAAAWAHELDWRPVPVFQTYAAWTEELDRRNAETVAAPDGPERILRQNLNPRGRYPAFESPAAMIAMLCHFQPLRTTPDWQVLGRAPNRCGEPRPLGSAEATYGTPIPIPPAPPSTVVFARVHGIDVSGLERLRGFLFRPHARQVTFEGDPTNYVFVPGTAANGLLLRAPRRIDFPAPFALAANADEMTFWGRQGDPLTVEFYSLPVRVSR